MDRSVSLGTRAQGQAGARPCRAELRSSRFGQGRRGDYFLGLGDTAALRVREEAVSGCPEERRPPPAPALRSRPAPGERQPNPLVPREFLRALHGLLIKPLHPVAPA